MRNKLNKSKCSGCSACYNACPAGAISMQEDNEGFLYPVIDDSKCTDCGLCEKVCFINHSKHFNDKKPDYAYAIQAQDDICLMSSSGGLFTLIAENILKTGGYVCGAAWSDDFRSVRHILISSVEELNKLRLSKYVQSDCNTVFREIKQILNKDIPVFFTGTPCQVEGLKNYLGKDYSNLLTADILCHSVPSPKVWRKYLDSVCKERKLQFVNFRSKMKSWQDFQIKFDFDDGSSIVESKKENLFFKSFIKNMISRPSCETCPFTCLYRVSDITLGDFWKINKFDKNLNGPKGTSLCLCNTVKGEEALAEIEKQIKVIKKVPIKYAIRGNAVLAHPLKFHPLRDMFFAKIDNMDILKNIKDTFSGKYDGVIANFWDSNYNYGATLTAYALQQFFKERGYDFRLLNLYPQVAMKDKNSFVRKFADKYLYLTEPVKNKKELSKLNSFADTFVVGSDQVFKDHCMRKYFDSFLLPYTDFSKRRIAFSASFGKDNFIASDEDKYILSKYLKRFDAISVREHSGIDICREDFDVEAERIMDPVFLADRECFLKLVDFDSLRYKDKIVCLLLDMSETLRKSIEELSRKLSAEVVYIDRKKFSIEEFLTAIYTCKYFVTDSFHGTCFAILFHKNFVTVTNESRGMARFESLIRIFPIAENFVNSPELINSVEFTDQNWDEIEKIINSEKEKADIWIKKVFETPRPLKMFENEFDLNKYSNVRKKLFRSSKSLFSITGDRVRITISIFGIKISIKRK